jgi:hypothetical protein
MEAPGIHLSSGVLLSGPNHLRLLPSHQVSHRPESCHSFILLGLVDDDVSIWVWDWFVDILSFRFFRVSMVGCGLFEVELRKWAENYWRLDGESGGRRYIYVHKVERGAWLCDHCTSVCQISLNQEFGLLLYSRFLNFWFLNNTQLLKL